MCGVPGRLWLLRCPRAVPTLLILPRDCMIGAYVAQGRCPSPWFIGHLGRLQSGASLCITVHKSGSIARCNRLCATGVRLCTSSLWFEPVCTNLPLITLHSGTWTCPAATFNFIWSTCCCVVASDCRSACDECHLV